MKFVSKSKNIDKYVDNIFSVVQLAKKDEEGINATAGCLYDEEGKLFTFDSVYKCENDLSVIQEASYASSPGGNKEYNNALSKFILEDYVSNNNIVMATPGGTGAIYTAMKMCLDLGDTIIYPEISWGNYKVMAQEFGYNCLTYDVYNLDNLFNYLEQVNKIFLIINSPCENPLGHSYSYDEWEIIINKLKNLNKEVILLCDIAYIDYANNNPKNYFSLFNNISDNILVLLAVSTSKAFSYYGKRLGALIAIHNDQEYLKHFNNLSNRLARSTWSNLNNGGMINIAKLLNENFVEYKAELDNAKEMLKRRVELFKKDANECNLDLYKADDGFFVTIKMDDNELRDIYHQKLIDNHIYTIKVNKGIRVALCSVPYIKVVGLAKKMKELM